ncbi:protein SCO1/2 [Halopenitus malekzadehii]|uniref:Protein SCO1/2 n=1 Tax=Halopenitus malekzadehii TaxID=1267564 RepID=A0A1H6J696_9EURY|nr:SCO family protein [Halopenitus malekzadehii]SEH57486.1 protein SCO1/2 [Halopenitus malekzadehii]
MDRRHYIRSLAGAGVVGTAGCLGSVPGFGNENTVLGPPEQDLSEASHPSYGDELPAVTLPDPIAGEEISTERIFDERDRAVLLTFFYTHCPDGICAALIRYLRRAQIVASEQGAADEAAFLPITFDPERDTAAVLREYADRMNVNLDAGNWHFLRPESFEASQSLIREQFGLATKKVYDHDYQESLEYTFTHLGYIFLVNKQGIIERVYPGGKAISIERVEEDFTRVLNQ